ncbi:DUF7693 family protein [Pseudomonas aeruginosa]
MTNTYQLNGREVAELLRDVIQGRASISLATPGGTWSTTYAGVVPFRAAGYTVAFFNDCDTLDYCQFAESPDGRRGEFEAWYAAGEEPIDLLTEPERLALEQLLSDAG